MLNLFDGMVLMFLEESHYYCYGSDRKIKCNTKCNFITKLNDKWMLIIFLFPPLHVHILLGDFTVSLVLLLSNLHLSPVEVLLLHILHKDMLLVMTELDWSLPCPLFRLHYLKII